LNIAEGLLHQVVGNDGHTTTISSNLDNIRWSPFSSKRVC
jgi:hypothetical protein